MNTGIFHESLNLAAAWKLPAVYVCENNLYSISVPITEVIAIESIAERARAYGMPGRTVDGNDVLAVRTAALEAVERARSGLGPSLIEYATYRQRAHSAGVPWETRPRQEIQSWLERDPLLLLRRRLSERGLSDRIAYLEQQARAVLETAVEFARLSPEPAAESLMEDVYA